MKRVLLIVVGIVVAIVLAAFVWMQVMHRGGGMGMGMDHMMSKGKATVEVIVPALSARAADGEALFDANCAACHGADAAGNEGAGPPLVHIIYEPSHHGDTAFQLAVANGVRQHHWSYGNMPPIAGVSGDDVTAITAYVRTLQRANGIE